MDRAYSYA